MRRLLEMSGGSFGMGYALVLVLFILLVIIGAIYMGRGDQGEYC